MNTTNNFDLSIADLILLLLDIAAIILHDYDLPPKNFAMQLASSCKDGIVKAKQRQMILRYDTNNSVVQTDIKCDNMCLGYYPFLLERVYCYIDADFW